MLAPCGVHNSLPLLPSPRTSLTAREPGHLMLLFLVPPPPLPPNPGPLRRTGFAPPPVPPGPLPPRDLLDRINLMSTRAPRTRSALLAVAPLQPHTPLHLPVRSTSPHPSAHPAAHPLSHPIPSHPLLLPPFPSPPLSSPPGTSLTACLM